jgi:hypothetical protein
VTGHCHDSKGEFVFECASLPASHDLAAMASTRLFRREIDDSTLQPGRVGRESLKSNLVGVRA